MRTLLDGRQRQPLSFARLFWTKLVPTSLFCGTILAVLIGGLMPAVYAPFGSLICDGTPSAQLVAYDRAGEGGWELEMLCVAADGGSVENMNILVISLIGYWALFLAAFALIAWWWRSRRAQEIGQPPAPAGAGTTVTTRNIRLDGDEAPDFLATLSNLSGDREIAEIAADTERVIDLSNADLDTKLRAIAGLRAQGLIGDEAYQAIVARIREKG